MSEHFLNAPQIRTVLYQMRRERMPQCMRCNIRLNIRLLRIVLDQLPEPLSAHGLPRTVRKQHLRLLILQHFLPGAVQIPGHRVLGRRTERNDPLLVAVTAENKAHLHIHIGKVQRD